MGVAADVRAQTRQQNELETARLPRRRRIRSTFTIEDGFLTHLVEDGARLPELEADRHVHLTISLNCVEIRRRTLQMRSFAAAVLGALPSCLDRQVDVPPDGQSASACWPLAHRARLAKMHAPQHAQDWPVSTSKHAIPTPLGSAGWPRSASGLESKPSRSTPLSGEPCR